MKKKRWVWLWIALAVVVPAAIVEIGTGRTLDGVQARARAAGLALTVAEMRANPPDPKENAAADYRDAISAIKSLPAADRTLLNIYDVTIRNSNAQTRFNDQGVPGHVDWSRVETALKTWQPVFERFDRATEKPKLDWDRRWEMGIALLLPEFADLKMLSKAVVLDAEAAARRGDHQHALKRLGQLRVLSDHIEQEPLLIAFLVGIAIRNTADKKAMDLAYGHPGNEALVAGVRKFFEESNIPDARPALRGEAFATMAILDAAARDTSVLTGSGSFFDGNSVDKWKLRSLQIPAMKRSAQSRTIEKLTQAREALDSPDNWEAVMNALEDLDKAINADKSFAGTIGGLAVPIFAETGISVARSKVRLHLGIVLTELIEEKRRLGHWPATLPDCGKWSLDPFTGKALRYRITPEGFALHSVGPDRKDGGGRVDKNSYDITLGTSKGRLVLMR